MRENCMHGSEGGAAHVRPYPYQKLLRRERILCVLSTSAGQELSRSAKKLQLSSTKILRSLPQSLFRVIRVIRGHVFGTLELCCFRLTARGIMSAVLDQVFVRESSTE